MYYKDCEGLRERVYTVIITCGLKSQCSSVERFHYHPLEKIRDQLSP